MAEKMNPPQGAWKNTDFWLAFRWFAVFLGALLATFAEIVQASDGDVAVRRLAAILAVGAVALVIAVRAWMRFRRPGTSEAT